jgi:alkylhydroperoxidase family enzyme
MPRIPYRDLATLSAQDRAAIGEQPANVSRMLATASGPVFHAVSAVGSALINGSTLPPNIRELAILRVGYISKSRYETFQHEALARHVGMGEGEIAAIEAGDAKASALNSAQSAALEFVDDMVANVRASDRTLEAVRRHLSDAEVVDLIAVTGFYMLICRLLETTGVELDSDPIDWNTIAEPR